jgi:hypothetical protein
MEVALDVGPELAAVPEARSQAARSQASCVRWTAGG